MSRSKKDTQPYWRPNFQIPSTLPDIKIVRTDFIINLIAVTVALGMLFLVGQNEFRAQVLRNSIEDMERRIRLTEADDNKYLKQSEAFRKAANYVVEVDRFYDTPVVPHRQIVDLLELKPEDLIFNRIAIVEQVVKQENASMVEYRITMTGEVKELTVLDQFKGELSRSELFNLEGYSGVIDESLESRDPKTGIFPYRLTIVLSPTKATPAKAEN